MKTLAQDTKAQGKAITLIVTVVVAAIVGAVLVPVAINQLESDDTTTITQNTTETVEVDPELNSTLDDTDTTGDNATYSLEADNNTITKTIDNGSTATYNFDRGDVNVTVDDVQSGQATATFEYPKDFSYSSGASAIWGILGLTIVLGLFLYMIGRATRAF